MNQRAKHDRSKKLKVLNHAKNIRNISKACRYFGICRETLYTWRRAYDTQGKKGLIDSRPCPENHVLRITYSKAHREESNLPAYALSFWPRHDCVAPRALP